MTIPGWAVLLVRAVALPGRAEDVIGDLNEMLGRRARSRSPFVAWCLTLASTLDMTGALLRERVRSRTARAHMPRSDLGPYGYGFDNRGRWDVRRFFEDWIRDLIQAARSLVRAPGFTVVTTITLAVAIGANAAIFSVVDTVLLDPLDYPDSDRLVAIRASAPGSDLPPEFPPGMEFYVQYEEEASQLASLGMYRQAQTTVRSDERIDRLFVVQATPTLFTTLGVAPIQGRLPTVEDDPGTVMVISYDMWTEWLGGDPEVVGRSYDVSGMMMTVIGIMGPEFRFPDERTSLWAHGVIRDRSQVQPGDFGANLLGRMTDDAEHETLAAELDQLASRLPERFGGPPAYARIIEQHRSVVRSLEEDLVGDISRPLWLLLGTVGIVLLIACANVANLFTVRAESRVRDLSVRQALGAGRGSLIRAQMSEALLLAAMGGIGGAALAWLGLPILVRVAPENIPNLGSASLDSAALAFTAAVSFLTALAFGLLPALRFSRLRYVGGLRQSSKGLESRGNLSRDILVAVQTAAALVLLVGSGLLMRSFWTLNNVDPGFDTENIFTFQVAPDRPEVNDGPSFAQFHSTLMDRIRELPGVERVGLTNWLPLDEGAATNTFVTESSQNSGTSLPPVRMTLVGGDYFETMGIELEQGRVFEPSDHLLGGTAVVVGRAAADLLWPGEDPIGKLISPNPNLQTWMQVVGVVEDIFLDDFRQDSRDPMVYLPMVGPQAGLWAVGSPAYVVKTERADVIAPDIRALLREEVPESPFYRIFTMEFLADRSMAQLSFTMLMLAIASGLALVLGAVGLYGVLSYVVTSRSREIAVRMALGAEAPKLRRMVVKEGAKVTLVGVVVGLVAAFGLTRVLDSLLFGVGSLDIPTFMAMSALMLTIALVASYVPARRASSVDPMQTLRTE